MFLCGSYAHQLDEKNRIRLPAKFRNQLGDKYVLLPGSQGCIYLFKDDEAQTIMKQLSNRETLNPEVQDKMRTLFSIGGIAEADAQGRFSIPPSLVKFAQIGKDIYINGNVTKVEIWDAKIWEKRLATIDSTPKGIDEIYSMLSAVPEKEEK